MTMLRIPILGICLAMGAVSAASSLGAAPLPSPSCRPVATFYGELEVCEEVVHELIASDAMQRLKGVMQYGLASAFCQSAPYNRYDHSLGVFYLLRHHQRPFTEQLAGLLHDVSHTTFSHLGDVYHKHEDASASYQDDVHLQFLQERGIGRILERHGFTLEDVDHKREAYHALEQDLPAACADRLDYNIQGAYRSNILSYGDVQAAVADLRFEDGKWSFSERSLALKLARYSISMSKHCWSSVESYLANFFTSQALKQAIGSGELTSEDLAFGSDASLWQRLTASQDEGLQLSLRELKRATASYRYLAKERALQGSTPQEGLPSTRIVLRVPVKFRGFDPWIRDAERGVTWLTELDPFFRSEFLREQDAFKDALYISY